MSKQAVYRRRRIIVLIAALAALSLTVFCVYSVGQGIAAVGSAMGLGVSHTLTRDTVPDPTKIVGVPDCASDDITLSLQSASSSIPVGGSVDFTATITYTGTSKAGCLIDASDGGRVLTITSGDNTVWRSDVCPSDARMLLMSKGDVDQQQITWNADATGSTCAEDGSLPRVNAGTYTARLSLKEHPKVTSDPVTIAVQ
ncbi:hypothetical protein DSM100688_1085 [Bifidobacterium ramosum]|nr:hypothetical protein [Bifidobacterium ramosum]KAB8287975.1 hypothetical protein DSM100688_1085 [Bifidobacterium ramosum]